MKCTGLVAMVPAAPRRGDELHSRIAYSFALRDFLGVGIENAPPDHSTISRTRRLIDLETHRAIFTWVLQCLTTAGLVKGTTIGIDATTLEANAALRGADVGDTTTIQTTLPEAAAQLIVVTDNAGAVIEELVADKGYHSKQTVLDVQTSGVRTYISEPDRGRQVWPDQAAERDAVYANRRRIHGDRGQRLLRTRGELLERPNAHLYGTGGMRRTHLRGHENILKRLLVHAGGCNLGLLMRTLIGVGTPRSLQGRAATLAAVLTAMFTVLMDRVHPRTARSKSWRSFLLLDRSFWFLEVVT